MDNEHVLLLQDFFAGIFEAKLDLSKVEPPVLSPGFTWIVKPEGLARQEIYEKASKHFKVVPGSWLKLEENNLKLSCPQPRPPGTCVFSYWDRQVPDEATLSMSQGEMATTGGLFMTIDEYLLATSLNKFMHGEFMDLYSETILAEYWCYGGIPAGMVYGFHQHRGRNPEGHDPEGYDGLCLFNGPPQSNIKSAGPRMIFLP